MSQDLSRYALRKEIPYIGEDNRIHYRKALSWATVEQDGTIVVDFRKLPREAYLHPPFDVIDEKEGVIYQAWIAEMEKFRLYPNYSIEEIGDRYAVVVRSDGVRFKVIGWIDKQILVDLAGFPEGIALHEFLTLMLARIAERYPDKLKTDEDYRRYAGALIYGLGVLHNECGLVLVEKTD
jgi:hypothetical protein